MKNQNKSLQQEFEENLNNYIKKNEKNFEDNKNMKVKIEHLESQISLHKQKAAELKQMVVKGGKSYNVKDQEIQTLTEQELRMLKKKTISGPN